MKQIFKNRIDILLLVIIIAAVYFPVSLLLHPMKWDMIDCALPWRFIVGESVHHGYLPMWNAYQSLGYPINADMQTIPWYLPAWLMSGIFPLTLKALSFEYIFHVVTAGIGMFWLLRTLQASSAGSLMFALSYSFSGVMVGNAQHYHHIIFAAWLPYVICSFYLLQRSPGLFRIIVFSFFTWLIITGGYLGLTFVLIYVLATWLIIHQFIYYKNHSKADVRVMISVLVSVVIIILLALPELVSLLQSLPYVNRTGGIALEKAQYGAFTLHSFISFVFPYATVKDAGWLGTDISMANIYCGIGILCLSGLGLFHPKKYKWFLVILILAALMVSMGKATPIRAFLYNYVPLMNYSRFPAIFRIFALIPLIFLASLGWKLLQSDFGKHLKTFIIIAAALLLLTLVFAVYTAFRSNFDLFYFLQKASFRSTDLVSSKQHLIFQAIIQTGILALLLIMSFILSANQKKWNKVFLLIVIIDLAVAVNLNAPYTVFDNENTFATVNSQKQNFSYGFDRIHDYKVSETDSICGIQFSSPLWRNLSNLNKHVSISGFTSFYLKSYEYLLDSQKLYLKTIIRNNVAFITNDVRDISKFNSDVKFGKYNSNTVYADPSATIDTGKICCGRVENIRISPDKISMDIKDQKSDALLVLLQNYYPYWKVFVNSEERPLIKLDNTLMGVKINRNTEKAEFRYDNKPVRYSFYISMLSLILVLAGMGFLYKKHAHKITTQSR